MSNVTKLANSKASSSILDLVDLFFEIDKVREKVAEETGINATKENRVVHAQQKSCLQLICSLKPSTSEEALIQLIVSANYLDDLRGNFEPDMQAGYDIEEYCYLANNGYHAAASAAYFFLETIKTDRVEAIQKWFLPEHMVRFTDTYQSKIKES